MKHKHIFSIWIMLASVMLLAPVLQGCTDDDEEPYNYDEVLAYTPILMNKDDLRKSVKGENPRALNNPGKIWVEGNRIYIIEQYEGVHIIDNSDPSAPVNVRFIYIPGIKDVAIKDGILYADNAIDLVAIDISNPVSPALTSRVPDVFDEMLPPQMDYLPSVYAPANRPDNTVIIGWIKNDMP